MMKNLLYIVLFLGLSGCGGGVEKPDNLIGRDTMVDIFYDLAILEAMRSQMPIVLEKNHVDPDKYIYKKYKIDSIQFAKSNQYYASDISAYKKMYEEVAKRLGGQNNGAITDPNAPQIQ